MNHHTTANTRGPPDPDTIGVLDTRAAAPIHGDATGPSVRRVVETRADRSRRRPSWETEPVRLIISEPSSPTSLRRNSASARADQEAWSEAAISEEERPHKSDVKDRELVEAQAPKQRLDQPTEPRQHGPEERTLVLRGLGYVLASAAHDPDHNFFHEISTMMLQTQASHQALRPPHLKAYLNGMGPGILPYTRAVLSRSHRATPPVGQGGPASAFSSTKSGYRVVAPSDSGYGSVKGSITVPRTRTSTDTSSVVDHQSVTETDLFSSAESDVAADQDRGDAATVYSDAGSLSDERVQGCVEEFASDLFHRMGFVNLSRELMNRALHVLPSLLKAFAFATGYEAATTNHLDIMYFVCLNRHAIVASVRDQYLKHTGDRSVAKVLQDDRQPVDEVVGRWLDTAATRDDGGFEHQPPDYLHDPEPQEDLEEASIAEVSQYCQLIFGSDAYRTLLLSLRAKIELSQAEVMSSIRRKIISVLSPWLKVSRHRQPEPCRAVFTVYWDPFSFFAAQKYDEPPEVALIRAVTLTGSGVDAQAVSVLQYVRQTWPVEGEIILAQIRATISHGGHRKSTFNDGTTFEAWFEHAPSTKLKANVAGTPESVARAGQVLAWLGAALRCTTVSGTPVYCIPDVSITGASGRGYPAFCSIKFQTSQVGTPIEPSSKLGQCWHRLFRSPVIVGGFPIPRRVEHGLGLEIHLDLLANLVGATTVDYFDSKLFIKGFSAMVVPTKRCGDIIVWHLVLGRNWNRISYLDWAGEHADVTMAEAEAARHVVGWCSEMVYEVGAPGAAYDIRRSQLPAAGSGCLLERAQISSGRSINGTLAFAVGAREKPVNISRAGYIPKLKWIAGKYVVLWDAGAKRGWLVNGASALLHLLRSSLERSSKDKFKSAFLFDKLVEAHDPNSPDAAIEVLMNETNRQMPLYLDKGEYVENETGATGVWDSTASWKGKQPATQRAQYYRLEHRVEHLFGLLEKMIDHQTGAERRNGIQVKPRTRKQLEGWDFMEVYADGDPLFPRVVTLPAIGTGWVDFARSIHAIALFGRGFGDLIRPRCASPGKTCSRWSSLPTDRYYLAACVSELRDIMETNGDADANPRKLSDNILWHARETTFSPCPCTASEEIAKKYSGQANKHHDPVQALFPSWSSSRWKKKPQAELNGGGAVIFSHNKSIHRHWSDSEDQKMEDAPSVVEEQNMAFLGAERADSGIGSSISSWMSPSHGRTSSAGGSGSEMVDFSPTTSGRYLSPASADSAVAWETTSGGGSAVEIEDQAGGVKRQISELASSVKKRMRLGKTGGRKE